MKGRKLLRDFGVLDKVSYLAFSDNLTVEEVQPVLDGIAANLADVEGTIANVTDMLAQLQSLEDGFNNVSHIHPFIHSFIHSQKRPSSADTKPKIRSIREDDHGSSADAHEDSANWCFYKSSR